MQDLAVTRTSEDAGRRQRLAVCGDLDLGTALKLEMAIDDALAEGATDVTVDLAAAPFLDSTGLAALVEGHRRLADRGGRLRVVEPTPNVRRVIEFAGLDVVLFA